MSVRKTDDEAGPGAAGEGEDGAAYRPFEATRAPSETTIQKLLDEHETIFENVPVGIAYTADHQILRVNGAYAEQLGRSVEELVGANARTIMFTSDASYCAFSAVVGESLAAGKPVRQLQWELVRKDGRRYWASISARSVSLPGFSYATIWMFEDITESKRAKEAAEEAEVKLRDSYAELDKANEEMAAIFESSTFGIAFIKDRVMVKANGKLEELFGYAPGELRGQPTRCWYPDEESYLAVGVAYRDLQNGKTHRRVMKMRHKDGSLFWARLSGCALTADLSRGSVWTVEDITAEHDATEAMLRAKESAEEAEGKLRDSYAELEEANRGLQKLDQMKSDFLSSVSHELRTPLTSIRGFSQLIDRDFTRSFVPLAQSDAGLNKKALRIQDNLKIILKESERLTRLINDVLDLAKIEAGRTDWRDATIDIAGFMQDAANAAQGMFEQKPALALCLEIDDDLPPCTGDADRLQQVMINLLNNAAKFTDRGAVTMRAFVNAEQLIQIEVEDTGLGFPQDEAEAIFDKFQQAKQGNTLLERPKGTGLGLAICREIVNRHGGRVWARSQPGVGSIFALTLPPAERQPGACAPSQGEI